MNDFEKNAWIHLCRKRLYSNLDYINLRKPVVLLLHLLSAYDQLYMVIKDENKA